MQRIFSDGGLARESADFAREIERTKEIERGRGSEIPTRSERMIWILSDRGVPRETLFSFP